MKTEKHHSSRPLCVLSLPLEASKQTLSPLCLSLPVPLPPTLLLLLCRLLSVSYQRPKICLILTHPANSNGIDIIFQKWNAIRLQVIHEERESDLWNILVQSLDFWACKALKYSYAQSHLVREPSPKQSQIYTFSLGLVLRKSNFQRLNSARLFKTWSGQVQLQCTNDFQCGFSYH